MAKGDPIRAREIFEEVDKQWFDFWLLWMRERRKAKVPDSVIGMYGKD